MQKDISKLILEFPALCIPDNWNSRYPQVSDIPDTTRIWRVPIGRRFFAEIRNMDPYKAVEAYHRPVLIVHGDADAVVPIEYSRRAVKLYKNARLVEIPKAGHGFNGKDFKCSLDNIRQFLMGKENITEWTCCHQWRSSSDLTNWQFERVVLPVQKDGILGPNRVGERAKVMKCPLMFYCCFIR